eukprot:6927132-Pyramimonas_sp.AAC.1
MTRPVPETTSGRWKEAEEAAAATGGQVKKKHSEHCFSGVEPGGKAVWVGMRWNKPSGKIAERLATVKWQDNPQLVQVNIEVFRTTAEQEQEELEILACKWCSSMAKRFCDGKLDKAGMLAEKSTL